MSFWNKVIGSFGTNGKDSADTQSGKTVRNSSLYAFVDVEVGLSDHKIHDIGAVRYDGATFHSPQKRDLLHFLKIYISFAVITSSIMMPNIFLTIQRTNGRWWILSISRLCFFQIVRIIAC